MALTETEIAAKLKEIYDSAPPGIPPMRFLHRLLVAQDFDAKTATEEKNAPGMPPAFGNNWAAVKTYLTDRGGHHDMDVLVRRAEEALAGDEPQKFWRLLLHIYKAERLLKSHITGLRPGA
jgi:hypothetical protein